MSMCGIEEEHQGEIKATRLGHACFLVDLPSVPSLGRSTRVPLDPVFSDMCSPTQSFGPKRYTAPLCKIEDMPEVDAVVIPLDNHTLSTLFKRVRGPHIFAPLGNAKHLGSIGAPTGHAHARLVGRSTRRDTRQVVQVDLYTCGTLPAGGVHDQGKTLWSSWAVEGEGKKVYFAETGPAFKEIGEHFGEFDLAMILIGYVLSFVFLSPMMWVLTTEEVTKPPKRLTEECRKIGIEDDFAPLYRFAPLTAILSV
ncbi:hypothetical protein IW261DRAFT_1628738 [Armillaria novae-zelandiae]|uniref:Metallo-beta-lactamase domain-containing protein n=1 Tax=Armillaria novae-zelandiae TaxID=153914 RepID=A0AA39NAQ6_9AGAR|nr:hypothetical protein IW261DRAFT_1628738 [Armillaria novae-zelandiae]